MKKVIRLPKALAPHKHLLKETMTSFVSLVANAAPPDRAWNSKIGGAPFMPKGSTFPVDKNGKPMYFLAQINLSEFENVADFPTTGMLYFFLSENAMYDQESTNNVAVIHLEVGSTDELESITNEEEITYEDLPFNIATAYVLTPSKSIEIAPLSDIAFDGKMGYEFWRSYGEEEYDIRDKYSAAVSAAGHKMGGYAHFAQEDPRSPDHNEVLLLQLDSDDKIGMKWGDMGVAHFFINRDDLEKRDFSKVTFHWDCH